MKRYVIKMVFLCFLAASSSQALGVMISLSTEELTKSSDLILVGSVKSVESLWSEDGKFIISRAKVIVNSVINGKWDKDIVTVEYVGGEVGDIGLKVSDVKPLKQGDNLLLFLKVGNGQKQKMANDEIHHTIAGNAQGQYTITPQGIAKKDGFSVMQGRELIDNDLPLEVLIDKIRAVKK
jgi:hypothetical protein